LHERNATCSDVLGAPVVKPPDQVRLARPWVSSDNCEDVPAATGEQALVQIILGDRRPPLIAKVLIRRMCREEVWFELETHASDAADRALGGVGRPARVSKSIRESYGWRGHS
jgi:hypothetical protein